MVARRKCQRTYHLSEGVSKRIRMHWYIMSTRVWRGDGVLKAGINPLPVGRWGWRMSGAVQHSHEELERKHPL